MNKYILALDQGTTSSRAVLYDASFRIANRSQREFLQIYPHEGWVEHNPLAIWESLLECIREVVRDSSISASDVLTIGITNQRETVVAWNRKTGKPIFNAIVWQDRRTAKDCETDLKELGLEFNRNKTGLNLDAYFSASKIRWILKNVPEAKLLVAGGNLCVGTVDTWLIWNLTGGTKFITDYSNASRTNLFNVQTLNWDSDLLRHYQIPISILPDLVDSIGEVGKLDLSILGAPIPIAGIAGDQQAALFGHGCWKKGMMKNTFGTGCFLLQNIGTDFKLSNNQLLTTIAWKDKDELIYAIEGSVFNAGSALKWLKENLNLFDDYSEADKLCESIESTDNVYFVPAFTGLGAPYWDMYARGSMYGLNRNTRRKHIIRATFESLVYQSRDIIDTMASDSGSNLRSIQIDGGVSKSPFLKQFLADILQIDVIPSFSSECTALGVALMAAKAVGISIDGILSIKETNVFYPKLSVHRANKLYSKWQDAVKRTKGWV